MTEFTISVEDLFAESLPPHAVLAKGALDSQIGKTVPVVIGEGENRRQIGEATIFQDGEIISASIHLSDNRTIEGETP